MRRQLSSHFYSGKVPLVYILQSVHYNISTQAFSRDTFPLSAFVSQLAMGCVTCQACHGCVTDFRPILGNPVEVTHVTSLGQDRKSTRLNSSHTVISYAVFCL